ncbi:MAG: protease inhibitor I42 family protein [Burkholderiales bacterium]
MENQGMTNNLRVWGSFALCVPLALLGGCASGDKPKPVVVQSVIQAPGKAYVTVANANDGAAVVLDTTQELRVELSLSGFEVANNMDWSVSGLKPGVLTTIGSRFDRATRDVNPLESAGATVWRLKPQAPGQVRLSFELRRAYSLGAPTKSVSFDVTVK